MKVAIVNNHFASHNGADVVAYALFCQLRDAGIDTVFFGGARPPYFEPDYEYISLFGEAKPFRDMSWPERAYKAFDPFYNPRNYHKFKHFLEVTKPDIVHYHSINRYLTGAVLKAAYDLNIPTIQTLHDAFLACPAGTLLRAEKTYCDAVLCASKSALACVEYRCLRQDALKSAYVATEFEARKLHQLYFKSDAYIVPSEALKEVMQHTPIPQDKIHVVHNLLEPEFEAADPHFEGGNYLLFVGRMVKEKGLHYLLEALQSFRDLELRVMGDGPDMDYYKAMARRMGLTKIRFFGSISMEELQHHYRDCLALVQPCNWFESYGLTVIEAQAHGKPVIASRIGGITELIEQDVSGLLIEPGNVAELKAAIRYCLENPEHARALGKSARKAVLERDLFNNFRDKTLALYKAVLAEREVGSNVEPGTIPKPLTLPAGSSNSHVTAEGLS